MSAALRLVPRITDRPTQQRIRALWRMGMDTQSIAIRVGVTEAAVYNFLMRP